MATAGEKTRFSILFLLLIAAGATYYLITASQTPVFVGGQTYYMPGQNKNCAWNVYFENDVYLKRGSFSNIHIGLPDRENRGSIKGIVESTENDLLLAFSFPGSTGKAAPVVLTASHDDIDRQFESIRFKLFSSSVLTVLIFKDQKSCIERYLK
jgi:hypothetical protein